MDIIDDGEGFKIKGENVNLRINDVAPPTRLSGHNSLNLSAIL